MIHYLFTVALVITGCFCFYKVFLQKETFFHLNRFVLLGCLLLAFALPLIPIPRQWSFRKAEVQPLEVPYHAASVQTVTSTAPDNNLNTPPAKAEASAEGFFNNISLAGALVGLYWIGVCIFGINFLVQLISLLYRAYKSEYIQDGRFRIVEISGNKAPCSFGNFIFINPEKYDWDTYNQILLHEKAHSRGRHSRDLLLAEIGLIFQWFNPFAWLYRKAVEDNLEFLTDDSLVQNDGIEIATYQMSLLKVSAPHFPLSITTNYNQSLLKKRLVMMTAKKSNIHTTWKYLFILPLLLAFVCLFNEPVVYAKTETAKATNKFFSKDFPDEGYWFATIKGDKINIQFKSDETEKNYNNSSTFKLSDFKNLPRDKEGTFSLTREPGNLTFTGKFDGNQGMGRYKFTADKSFTDYLQTQNINTDGKTEPIVYFMINLDRAYVKMLKDEGYTNANKDIIPLRALNIDREFIQSIKKYYPEVSAGDLIPLKALGVTGSYIDEMKKAGYPNISISKLISFKAQGIDAKYAADIKNASKAGADLKETKGKNRRGSKDDMNVNINPDVHTNPNVNVQVNADVKAEAKGDAYIKELQENTDETVTDDDLIAMKSLHVNPEFIQGFKNIGYTNVKNSDLIGLKSLGVTPEYVKSFEEVGIVKPRLSTVTGMKSMGITAEYIRSFQKLGYKNISPNDALGLKAQGITAAVVQQYRELGYPDISLDDVVAAQATGTTPAFIASMKQKGHNLKSIDKYIALKTTVY